METIKENISPSARGTGIQSIIGVDMDACIRSKTEPSMIELGETFGFVPNRTLYMRLDKSLRHKGGLDSIIRTTAALANSLPCDMLLVFNSEYPYLVRHAGKMTFNSHDPKLWDAAKLHHFTNLPEDQSETMKDLGMSI